MKKDYIIDFNNLQSHTTNKSTSNFKVPSVYTKKRRNVKELKRKAREYVDTLYETEVIPYKENLDLFRRGEFKMPNNVFELKKSLYMDETQRLKEIKKWIDRVFYDEIIKDELFYGNNQVLDNINVNINTGDTGFNINDVNFWEKLVRKDTHISAAVYSLVDSIISRSWEVIPSISSKKGYKVADFVDNVLREKLPDFAEAIETMAFSIVPGFSVQEIVWSNVKGDIIPINLLNCNPVHFGFDLKGNMYYESGIGGEKKPLPRGKFLVHAYRGNRLKPYGESILGEKIFWMYYFKRMVWRFRFRFLERFGNPIMIHKFQTEDERIQMFEALKYMASKGAIQVPEGSEITAAEVIRDTEDFKHAIDDLNREIEIAIVGQTATMSRENGGSYASDYIRQDQFYNKSSSLLKSMEATINNYLIKPMVKMNFPQEKSFPTIEFDKNDDVLKIKETERDLSIIRQNLPYPVAYLFRKLKIPIPKDMDINLTTGAYYDKDRNILGGLPPELRHQIRDSTLNDPRLEDIGATKETPKYDSEIEDEDDPDYIRQKEKEKQKERAQQITKAPGEAKNIKGSKTSEQNNPKNGKK
jgi:hypothetical protein